MRAALFLLLTTGIAHSQSCRHVNDLARLTLTAQHELQAVHTGEGDSGVPSGAVPLLTKFKASLAETVVAEVSCLPASATPKEITSVLAQLLHANHPQPPGGTIVPNNDPRYTEWLQFSYGHNLTIKADNLDNALLRIDIAFHIECGDDHILLLFEPAGKHWHELLRWQAVPYHDIGHAFGDVFLSAVVHDSVTHERRFIVVHGHPWCTSRFSAFDIDVLAPQANADSPMVVWHTERNYSRGDYPARLTASGETFELRINADEMEFNEDGFERTVVYCYQVQNDQVTRVEPIALNARTFMEEWLSMPWNEAKNMVLDGGALRAIHRQHETSDPENSNNYTSWADGPVRACKDAGHFQVEVDSELQINVPGKPEGKSGNLQKHFFSLSQLQNGYQITDARSKPNPSCTGPNLMHKSP